jgi:hypothetical protein
MPHRAAQRIVRLFRDRQVNPVLLKEARQAVRSNQFAGLIVLLLGLLIAYSLIFLVAATGEPNSPQEGHGGGYLAGLMVFLGLALGLSALDMLRRLIQEREPGSQDMLYVTPLSAGALVRGKALAGLAQSLLILSLGLPFLALAYFLRGIDLPSILCGGLLLLLAAVALVLGAVLVAALPVSPPMKWLTYLAFGFFVGIAFLGFTFDLPRSHRETWKSILGVGLALLPAFWAFYAAGVFLLSPPQGNRTRPLRVTFPLLSLAWFAGGVAAAVLKSDTDWLMLPALATLGLVAFALHLNLLCPEQMPRRVLATLPRRRWRRLLVLPLREGRAGGLLWAVLWIAGYAALFEATLRLLGLGRDTDAAEAVAGFVIGAGYLLCYALTACTLERVQRRWHTGLPAALIFPPLAAAGSTVSWALGEALAAAQHGRGVSVPLLGCALPTGEEQASIWLGVHLLAVLLWCTVGMALNRTWLVPAIRTAWHGAPPGPVTVPKTNAARE